MRFEKRFPSLTLTLSRAKIDRCRLSERRVDASSFSFSTSLLASLTLANPSWIYSKECVTNDPLRKFSRLLLPEDPFFRDCRLTRREGEGIRSIRSFQDLGRIRKGRYAPYSLFQNLPRSDFFLPYPRATLRIHRGNKCWKHPDSRVSIPWTEEVLLISSV